MPPRLPSRLDDVLHAYDALLCDIWGVIHNGRSLYAEAADALVRARAAGRIVILISNVPRPKTPIPGQLDRMGLPRAAWDEIVTSGDATRAELAKRAPGPMYKIGPDYDGALYEGLGLTSSGFDVAAFIAATGLAHEDTETPADYADLLKAAKARDLDFVCANPDIVVRVGDRLIWCAGALARDYEALGGRVVMAGKPFHAIYALAYAALNQIAGREIPKNRILAIGDGVPTDVRGANAEGLDCLFIAGGMHGEKLLTGGRLDPGKAEAALSAETATAAFLMDGLR